MLAACVLIASFHSPAAEPKATQKSGAARKPKAAAGQKAASTNAADQAKGNLHVPIQPPEPALIKQDHVNVRGQAALAGEVITRLRKGEPILLLEEINLAKTKPDEPARWFQIALPTNTPVWINAEFVDPNNKTVLPKKLNVRAGPGENYSVIARLDKGTEVKEIRKVNNWLEIEAPTNAVAFIAAEFVSRQSPQTPPVNPAPAPEIAAAPTTTPAPPVTTPVPAPAVATPAPTDATPAPLVTAPIASPGLPATTPAPAAQPLPKRIVTREGFVRRATSIQAPSDFELAVSESGRTMDYLHTANPDYNLKLYVGFKVIVTGEELLDPRWPKTPVIEIDKLDLP